MKVYEMKLTVVVNVDDNRDTDTASADLLNALSEQPFPGVHVGHARVDAVTDLRPMRVRLEPDDLEVHQ